MKRYGVQCRLSSPYHPQSNGHAEIPTREIKSILEKRVNPSRKNWSARLENALWAYMTAYNTLIGMSPYRIIFGKKCHLPVGIEHRVYWAVQQVNMDARACEEERKLQLQEVEELRLESFETTKLWHDKNLRTKDLQVGQKVLLFQSRLKQMSRKLKSKWTGPYIKTALRSNGAVKISGSTPNFEPLIVNGHRLKVFRDNAEVCVVEEIPLHAHLDVA
ncbi:uncharacterized protein LOC121776794 [Salvia splendens]|uniref:uncharacterized protein LOC121776794 n=1 Tax=Salvia splendens TaxID=180675 RepID=UPI001C253BF0|nr:uncharacterized protein LOC121776794 [Salvia splendens]